MLQHIATGWPNACHMLRYVTLKCRVRLTKHSGSNRFPKLHALNITREEEEVRPCLTKYWKKYIYIYIVQSNRTVSLSVFQLFVSQILLIRSARIRVLCFVRWPFLKFTVFITREHGVPLRF